MMNSLFISILCVLVVSISSFSPSRFIPIQSKSQMKMSLLDTNLNELLNMNSGIHHSGFMLLADTSISEEEVLSVVGQTTELPDPLFAVGVAFLIFLGVAVLQFSLGDLTREVN